MDSGHPLPQYWTLISANGEGGSPGAGQVFIVCAGISVGSQTFGVPPIQNRHHSGIPISELSLSPHAMVRKKRANGFAFKKIKAEGVWTMWPLFKSF